MTDEADTPEPEVRQTPFAVELMAETPVSATEESMRSPSPARATTPAKRNRKKRNKKKKSSGGGGDSEGTVAGGGGGGGSSSVGGGGDGGTAHDSAVPADAQQELAAAVPALAQRPVSGTIRYGAVVSDSNRDASRDIATAAGVVWQDEPPPRMLELQRRHDAIVDVAESGQLTLHHIKDHNEYLAGLTKQIADEGEQMKRRFRIATAKQSRSHDLRRASIHQSQASAIMRRQQRYNNEVAMAQCEVDWLRNSPAYAQAMEFLDKHWVKTAKGDYVSKKDLSDDMNVSFDDLLSSMKSDESERQQHGEAAAAR